MSVFINIHTHKVPSKGICIQNSSFNEVFASNKYYSLGIHPWDIDKADIDAQLEMLKTFCIYKKIVAIGEIGIDRAIQINLELQKEVFRKQLEIAKPFNLPVIIHCVKSWSDILEIRKEGRYKNVWIFHGFNGSLQTATQIIKSGCYLSFGKTLLTNEKLQETFIQLPKDFIFFETDDSDTDIEVVYEKASELINISIDDLKNVIYQNFDKIFLS